MPITTMRLDSDLRDELAQIAQRDFAGVSLSEALRLLIKEHEINLIMRRCAELRANPKQWASYQAETRLIDNVAGETLPHPRDEYPEYN